MILFNASNSLPSKHVCFLHRINHIGAQTIGIREWISRVINTAINLSMEVLKKVTIDHEIPVAHYTIGPENELSVFHFHCPPITLL